jgi:hypothetical protein
MKKLYKKAQAAAVASAAATVLLILRFNEIIQQKRIKRWEREAEREAARDASAAREATRQAISAWSSLPLAAAALEQPARNRRKLRHTDPTDIMGRSKLETIWEEDEEDEEPEPEVKRDSGVAMYGSSDSLGYLASIIEDGQPANKNKAAV